MSSSVFSVRYHSLLLLYKAVGHIAIN